MWLITYISILKTERVPVEVVDFVYYLSSGIKQSMKPGMSLQKKDERQKNAKTRHLKHWEGYFKQMNLQRYNQNPLILQFVIMAVLIQY